MSASETLKNIKNNKNLATYSFKYCLVNADKLPYKIDNKLARPNKVEDFVELSEISKCRFLKQYAGIGISIQASNISAIDVDHCFDKPFDISTADKRGRDIIDLFRDHAYIEFSFSGTGMRILFVAKTIKDYSVNYFTKNDKSHCEFYQPNNSARYVTLTGRTIQDFDLNSKLSNEEVLYKFLDKYLKKPIIESKSSNMSSTNDDRTIDQLLKIVKSKYLRDFYFQNLWFDEVHAKDFKGGSRESNNDYALLSYLYDSVTQDKEKLKLVFESSPYFKTKDKAHVYKWNYNNFRYYNYIYEHLK